MKYNINDIVLVKSPAGDGIPPVHVRLLKKISVPERKTFNSVWPGYVGWEARLIYKNEVDMLRKRWRIPFKFPEETDTFVYESDIIKLKKRARRKNKRK